MSSFKIREPFIAALKERQNKEREIRKALLFLVKIIQRRGYKDGSI